MKKRIAMLLMSALMITGIVGGCGKEASNDAPPTQSASTQTGEQLPSGTVELKFWCDPDEQALFQEMIDMFIDENKDKANIVVNYEVVTASTCKDTIVGDIENVADVFSMPDDQLLTLVAAGVLEPIANGEELAAQHLEGAVDAASVNGKLYAYPVTADNGYFIFYDKKYFKENEVTTLDSILDICAQNNKKFVLNMASGWYLYTFFGNTGLQVGLAEDGLTNFCDWNSTENKIKGVDVLQSMLNMTAHPGFMHSETFIEEAKAGTCIAGVSGVWDINAIKEVYGEDYGAVKMPTYTCAGQQVQMSSFTGYRLLGVNAYGKNREWAAKLAEFLTDEQRQVMRFERASRGPSNKNAASSDAIGKVPAIRAVLAQSEHGMLQKIGQRFWDPTLELGMKMVEHNPKNEDLQEMIDRVVEEMTQ